MQRSTGNVFRDLGFEPEEAASLKIRANLMIEIERLIQRRKLTQAAAAKLLGVTQPRVSDLVRGKIELFSIDTLVDMLTRAGVRVRVNVRRPHGRARGAKAASRPGGSAAAAKLRSMARPPPLSASCTRGPLQPQVGRRPTDVMAATS